MAILASNLCNYFSENYNEEAVRELLKGVIVDKNTINEKIKFIHSKFNILDIKKCIFYGRVSTKTKEQMSSIINQHNLASEFEGEFISNGFIVVEEVFERESATTAKKRKKFMEIVNRVRQADNDINFIVVKQVDRMFRNVTDTIQIMEELERYNVGLVFYWDGLNSLDTDDRNEIIAKANEAESYSNKLSKNVRRGQQRNINNGLGRMPAYCFGYDKPVVNNSAICRVNETESKLIQELFIRYGYNNETLGEIVIDWRTRGIKTKLNNEMSIVALRRMLTNQIYTGVIMNCRKARKSIRDNFENLPREEWKISYRPELRIVTDEIFEVVQSRVKEEQFGNQHMLAVPKDRIFKSMIKCPLCGKNFKQIKNGRKNEGYELYYVCATHKQKTRNAKILDCENRSCFRKDEMLKVLELYFKEMLYNRKDIELLIKNSISGILNKLNDNSNRKDYSEDIKKTSNKYNRELKLYRDGIVENTTELKKIKAELDNLKAKQAIENNTARINYNIDEVLNKLFISIEQLVHDGINEKTLDAIKFNGIFEDIVATSDNRMIINLKGSRVISNSLAGTFITPIEVEMRIYEEEVNRALIATAEREGKEMDVD